LALLVLLGGAAACGGDDGGESDEEAAATTAAGPAPSTTAPPSTTVPSSTTATGSDGADDDLCSVVATDVVAEATGQEVVDTRSSSGTGEVQGVEYRTVGCRYDIQPDGELEVQVLVDESGATADAGIFADLQETSLGLRPSDDFPHEELADLGAAAFFLNSLLSNQLFVDTGSAVLLVEGEIGEEEAPRAVLEELAAAAVPLIG
jgi:hypothetical protein